MEKWKVKCKEKTKLKDDEKRKKGWKDENEAQRKETKEN